MCLYQNTGHVNLHAKLGIICKSLCWFQYLKLDLIMLNLSLKIHYCQPEDYPLILHETWEAFPNKFLCMKPGYEIYCDTMETYIIKDVVLLSKSQ